MNAADREFLARLHDGIDRAETRRKVGGRTAMFLGLLVVVSFAWPRAPDREDIAVRPPVAVPAPDTRHDPVASLLLEAARLRLDGFGDRAAALPRLRSIIQHYPRTREAEQAHALLLGETS